MWPLRRDLDASDFELEPVPFFEMMNAPVERQQELEPVVERTIVHIIRGYDSATSNEHSRKLQPISTSFITRNEGHEGDFSCDNRLFVMAFVR